MLDAQPPARRSPTRSPGSATGARCPRARAAPGRRPTTPRRSCSRSSTSTASSTTTTPSGTRPATRCSSAWAASSPPHVARPGRAYRMGGDEFCVLLGRRRGADALARRRLRRPGRARRGLRDRRVLRRVSVPGRGDRPGGGAAPGRPAHVRPQALRPGLGRPPEPRRAAARRWPSATPSCATTSTTSPRSPPGRARGWASTTRTSRAGPPRRRAARRRQDRDPRRDPAQARPARRARVGVHAPPHADRRAHRRSPRPRCAASPGSSAPATSAGTARGYPDGAGRRGHPARRADRRRVRRLRRDGHRPALPAARCPRPRRWPSCAAAPGRSSTRRCVQALVAVRTAAHARPAMAA